MKSITHHYMDLVSLSKREAISIFLLAFVASFGLTFRAWGDSFDLATGLFNWISVFICMIFVILLHEFGHKILGALRGCSVEIKEHGAGLISSIIVQIFTFGFLPLFTPNLWEYDAHPERRFHKEKKYNNEVDELFIAGGGLVGTSVAILAFKILHVVFAQEVFYIATVGAVLHGIFSLIPFEILHFSQTRILTRVDKIGLGDGGYLLWQSYAAFGHIGPYLFSWLYMALFALLALILNGAIPFFLIVVISLVTTWIYVRWAN